VVDSQGHESGETRVLRGGSFADIPQSLRSATRHELVPTGRDQVIGFRMCFFAE
jgi:formylglycine-generating enzyme required for sulfatase activity